MENVANAVQASTVRVEVIKNPIVVSKVYQGEYQKEGELQAELKQTVETKTFYPEKTVTTDLQDNPFKQEEFQYEDKEYKNSRTDVAWLPVPSGSTAKDVLERIAINPKASLYRILSNYPIFNSNQLGYMDSIMSDETKTKEQKESEAKAMKDKIANSQVLRYGNDDATGKFKKGDLILDSNGKPQYKAVFFTENGKGDVDQRRNDFETYYSTDLILTELQSRTNSVLTTQKI